MTRPLTLKHDSQLGQFFQRFGYQPTDLCRLCLALVWAPALLIAFGVLVGILLAGVLLWWGMIFGVVSFSLLGEDAAKGAIYMSTVVFVLSGLLLIADALEEAGVGKLPILQFPIVGAIYHGWKEKYCPLIRWE